jgi:pimeloyl-ACP methyl ester carboxylesterase
MKPRFSPWNIHAFAACIAVMGVFLGIAAERELPDRVRAGDHQLRVLVRGNGTPTVILESFGPANLEAWNRIQPGIARFTRVFSYDHGGYGGSEPGPKPRDATQIARELRVALRNAEAHPPYVLVGYSFGGPYIRVFASLFPDEIIGMVFVDPTQEGFMLMLNREFPEMNVVTDQQRREQGEWGMQWSSMKQAENARLPVVPITLITGARAHDALSRHLLPRWEAEHAKWLCHFPWARHVVTTNSGHGVVYTEPELIIDAVRNVVEQARRNPN